jgi:hypothetical protein
MADWYVSSAAYAAIPQFAISTAYTVGQIIRPLTAPTFGRECVYRCTTAGTSAATEPTWSTSLANNTTIASGGATFTNITGQSAYGWSAAGGTLAAFSGGVGRGLVGDRIFMSSDHSETYSGSSMPTYSFNGGTAAFGVLQIISVNRAGSVPPVAADIQNGATIALNGAGGTTSIELDGLCNIFYQGATFALSGSGTSINMYFNQGGSKAHYLKNCAIVFSTTLAGSRITSNGVAKVMLDNTTVQFGNTAQGISCTNTFDFNWINTPSAIQGGPIPATLFMCGTSAAGFTINCRGVDLSAITGTLCSGSTSASGSSLKALFESCKVAPAVTRLGTPVAATNAGDEVELVNCYDGTNVLNERHTYAGDVTTDRSTYLSSGAQDDIGNYALKLASASRSDKLTFPLDNFWLDVENTAIGVSKTATAEIFAQVLNTDDISLLLEYMGTSGSSVASFVSSLPSNVLTSGSALASSSATWPSAFATWNPLDFLTTTLSNGNLTATGTAINSGIRAIVGYNTGKYYWEVIVGTWTLTATGPGIILGTTANFQPSVAGNASLAKTGNIALNGSNTGSTLGARAAGDIIGIAVDFAAQLIWFRVAPSGNWNGSGTANPATAVGGISFSTIGGNVLFPVMFLAGASEAGTANFGASAFSGAVPSGFASGLPMVPQKLQVPFTPQRAGRVRGLVKLGKPLATVWVNPQITVA